MKTSLYILSALLTSSSAYAQGGVVNGGGHTVDVDSTRELFDFVKGATCTWVSAAELSKQFAIDSTVFDRLAETDWYFASVLKREVNRLNFCLTGTLYRVNALDWESPVALPAAAKGYRQAAYRSDDSVYIDEEGFKSLSPNRRAYLLIHEAMHSFISMSTHDRKLKLRSMVNAIRLAVESPITNRAKLYLQMSLNECRFSRHTSELDADRKAIEFALASSSDQSHIVDSEPVLDSLIINDRTLDFLELNDARTMRRIGPSQILVNALISKLLQIDASELAGFLEKPTVRLNLVTLAMTQLQRFSPQKQKAFFATAQLKHSLKQSFDSFDGLAIEAGTARVLASPALAFLLGAEYQKQPFIGLPVAIRSTFELASIAKLITTFMQTNQIESLKNLITENEAFYSAIGLKSLARQALSITPAVAREKTTVLAVIQEAKQKLLQLLLVEIEANLTHEQNQAVRNLIHFERF